MKIIKKPSTILYLVCFSLSTFGQPQQLFYASTLHQLFKINISTCDTTLIGYVGSNPLHDLALTPDNRLYGIRGSTLFEIDTSNAALTIVTTFGINLDANSLVSDSAGNLLTVSHDSVYKINRFTGQIYSLGYFGDYSSAGDLTFYNDTLYLSADSGRLVKIILQPVISSQLVGIMTTSYIYGINTVCLNGYETMIASGGDMNHSSFYIVNTTDATLTLLCDSIISQIFYGAASRSDMNTKEGGCFTGINSPSINHDLKIFPNPLSDFLNISNNNSEQVEVIIFDIMSRQVLRKIFTNSVSLSIENLPAGVYLYRIENAGGIIKQGKLLKSKD